MLCDFVEKILYDYQQNCPKQDFCRTVLQILPDIRRIKVYLHGY